MANRIIAVVEDMIFLAKIRQTACQLNLSVEAVSPEALENSLARDGASAVLLDLNHRSGRALEVIHSLKREPKTRGVPLIAFLSHVQGELAKAARAAGCDTILARSAFSRQLPVLLQKLSRDETPGFPNP